MHTAGWICIALEAILLLLWVYNISSRNGTDPAGRGMAMGFIVVLIIYISAGALLMWIGKTWSVIIVLLMAGLPLIVMLIGLWRKYKPAKNSDRYTPETFRQMERSSTGEDPGDTAT